MQLNSLFSYSLKRFIWKGSLKNDYAPYTTYNIDKLSQLIDKRQAETKMNSTTIEIETVAMPLKFIKIFKCD